MRAGKEKTKNSPLLLHSLVIDSNWLPDSHGRRQVQQPLWGNNQDYLGSISLRGLRWRLGNSIEVSDLKTRCSGTQKRAFEPTIRPYAVNRAGQRHVSNFIIQPIAHGLQSLFSFILQSTAYGLQPMLQTSRRGQRGVPSPVFRRRQWN